MRVYGFKKDEQGFMDIENTLQAEQEFVGGLIECTVLTEEIDLVCNDEGWLIGLELLFHYSNILFLNNPVKTSKM